MEPPLEPFFKFTSFASRGMKCFSSNAARNSPARLAIEKSGKQVHIGRYLKTYCWMWIMCFPKNKSRRSHRRPAMELVYVRGHSTDEYTSSTSHGMNLAGDDWWSLSCIWPWTVLRTAVETECDRRHLQLDGRGKAMQLEGFQGQVVGLKRKVGLGACAHVWAQVTRWREGLWTCSCTLRRTERYNPPYDSRFSISLACTFLPTKFDLEHR